MSPPFHAEWSVWVKELATRDDIVTAGGQGLSARHWPVNVTTTRVGDISRNKWA